MSLLPTPEQIDTWTYFGLLIGGSSAVLIATWVISDYAIDWIVARWHRRRSGQVVDFSERRRLDATIAIRGKR